MRYIKAAAMLITAVTLSPGLTAYADDMITDTIEIYAYLKEYISFNLQEVKDITCVYRDGEEIICVEVYGIMSDSEKRLRQYIREMNIDESRVEFVWLSRVPDEQEILGDANSDGKVTVRDCAYIAGCLSRGKANMLPDSADYNGDGIKNVRDAAAISKELANKK